MIKWVSVHKKEESTMHTWQIVMIAVIVVMIAIMIVLYFLGKKAQKQKEEQDAQIAAAAQSVTMLVIDKKKMKMKEAGLPQQFMDQTSKMMRNAKLPIVKAKVGPKIMSFIADDAIFDEIPVKKEVKATVSGLYITGVKGLRGALEKPVKKKGFRAKLRDKYNSLSGQLKEENSNTESKKKKK
jgi:hypothetical protein